MTDQGLILGYFEELKDARSVLGRLWRMGFRRSALIYRRGEEPARIETRYIQAWRFWAVSGSMVFAGLAGLFTTRIAWLDFIPSRMLQLVASMFIGAVFGGLLSNTIARTVLKSVPSQALSNNKMRMLVDENLVLVAGDLSRLQSVTGVFRDVGESEPAIFVLHADRDFEALEYARKYTSLPSTQLRLRASRLARRHRVDLSGGGDPVLLKQVNSIGETIHLICSDLNDALGLEQHLGPTAEWILDNEYLIEGHVRDIVSNLPVRYFKELPALLSDPDRDLPRIYNLAHSLAEMTDARFDQENITQFIEGYQEEQVLSIGELWALPLFLRIALIERIGDLSNQAWLEMSERAMANYWAHRLLSNSRRDPDQLFATITEMAREVNDPSYYFGVQLTGHLYDEESVLALVQNWLERTGRRPLAEQSMSEQTRQAANQLSIGNAISSLRTLSLLDWRDLFERLSLVEQTLQRDPAGIYPHMDFETRNQYREAVEELARGSRAEEVHIAREAVAFANRQGDRRAISRRSMHVGTYLIHEGRQDFCQQLECREKRSRRIQSWVKQRHSQVYFTLVSVFVLMVMAPAISMVNMSGPTWLTYLALLLLLGPGAQVAIELTNYLLTRLLPASRLPKMDFETDGIPDAFRTLVVIPTLLVDEQSIIDEIEKLEIRYLANPEENLYFSLFSDYTDSMTPKGDSDVRLLNTAVDGIENLNRKYDTRRFLLLHRERKWVDTEQKFIGWERKRGKLEELNRLISGKASDDAREVVRVGDAHMLQEFRFVITLDSDTQLPRDTARRMVETLAHPLNQPQLTPDGRVAPGGYTIIQPRVSPSLPSASATPFSQLFTNPIGTDPYTKAVSNVYQDLTGETSYLGKGIYDPRIFDSVLGGLFPEQRLLSHDLIEGAYVRVGLASDIELFDEFPPTYSTYGIREHRWIRGDWQIIDWLLRKVPTADGGRVPNPLSVINRWKILDNLRRSLVPSASVTALICAWFAGRNMGLLAAFMIAVMLLFQPLSQPLTWLTSIRGHRSFSLRQIRRDVLRALAEAALLPHKAALTLDAILRTAYRRLVSRKRLLEWSTSQMARWQSRVHRRLYFVQMGTVSLASVIIGVLLRVLKPGIMPVAVPWLILWLSTPLVGWMLNRTPEARPLSSRLREPQIRMLRRIAIRTWRFFADFVSPDSHWLPPDNYQVSHQNEIALRTSPTNIGLWLLSALGASDFGYLTVDQMLEKVSGTLATLNQLDRFEGHLFNWYSLEDLTPLEPRYVSSVDSGNFIASVWTLIQGLEQLSNTPLLDRRVRTGLRDAAEVLSQALRDEGLYSIARSEIESVLRLLSEGDDSVPQILNLLDELQDPVHGLAVLLREHAGMHAGAAYWARMLERNLSAWQQTADMYFDWIAEAESSSSDGQIVKDYSLIELAGRNPSHRLEPDSPPPVVEATDAMQASLSSSRQAAQQTLNRIRQLIDGLDEFTSRINMRFLYDRRRRLFTVGYNVSAGERDAAYYDLLASEARLGGFVAIARNDVPVDHWLALGRPYSSHEGHRVLLSWTGTMFEYLMPLLFQRVYAHSLWDQAAHEAVELQIIYGRRRGVPWGVSESAFADLDIQRTYQYKAFGVPWLGLKRGLDGDLVIAPYATMLALPVRTRAAIRNLQRLEDRQMLDDYGFFEAIDFGRRPTMEGEPGVRVRAYMAHHQGMSFMALANALENDIFVDRFHSDPRVKAVEPLLYERVPAIPTIHHISTRDQAPALLDELGARPSVSKFDTPHTDNPKIQLLSNNRYNLLFTNSGGGYSRLKDVDLTRWLSDPTCDEYGNFCYIQDLDTGRLWSNTYHPVGGKVEDYEVRFPLDRAEVSRSDNGLTTETEVIVSPEDDVEIRRLTLINRSLRSRRISLTSYIELAMAPHASDAQHPAFNKLFIKTEAVETAGALIAYRRLRSPDEQPLFMAHRMTHVDGLNAPLQFETDRKAFIGRGRTLEDPQGASGTLEDGEGYVLDPIFSLRREIQLGPGERVEVSMVLAAGTSRNEVLALVEKYADPAAIQRAFELAWASAQLELRMLRIQPDQARRFQHLASYLIYPHDRMRPSGEHIARNQKGQSGLWPYSISGDYPIVLVSIDDDTGLGLVREMLQAQTYWKRHGLSVDLVILNEESSSYEQPLKEKLEQLIHMHSMYSGGDQPGDVFLRIADQMPEDDLRLLQSVARVSLVAARGPLSQQLGAPYDIPEPPEDLEVEDIPDEPSRQLPYMELPYFNGLGGFSEDGHEYVVYLGPGTDTPAPWVNVIANPSFGTLVSESGSGFSWFGNSQRNRLSEWSNDPVIDPPGETIYIRDEETGRVWNPTPSPIRESTAYRTRHGAGYTIFEHNSNTIDQELTVFVPLDDQGGEPVKVSRLQLTNSSSRRRTLSVTYYLEWTLGEKREDSLQHIVTQWDEQSRAIFAQNGYHPDYSDRTAFAAISPAPVSYTGDRKTFLGRNQSMKHPAAMRRKNLSGRVGPLLDPCAGLQSKVELDPGESVVVIGLLGQARSRSQARELIQKYLDPINVDQQLEASLGWWERTLGAVQVETPELAINFLLNRWLLYQSLSCRIWARSGFYQSGGAFGFRDQLQDVLSLLLTKPSLAREHILRTAGRQFEEGDVQHWWHPPSGVGVRTRISDDLLWLPFATAEYVRTTGDESILRESIRYLSARPLEAQEHEAFIEPGLSMQAGLLYDHCKLAVERGLTRGPNGLPLIGTGDWNDGMNRVGEGGRGESVWLGWFLISVLEGMVQLAEAMGEHDLAGHYQGEADRLRTTIDQAAWDGSWYLRARFDNGTPLGSAASSEARIDSLSQSWAWIAGGADDQRAKQSLDSAWRQLVLKDERLALLFRPPFDQMDPSPGYIQGYPPGVRENGGQYTHAAIWLAIALARSGDGNRASELLRLLNPVENARDIGEVWRYGLEPYVAAADVYRLTGRVGAGGWSWYTGSGAWMYRAWIEEVLGIKRRRDFLHIDPVIPSNWVGYKLTYRHGDAIYEVDVQNPDRVQSGVRSVTLDGRRMESQEIPLDDRSIRHSVTVILGESND